METTSKARTPSRCREWERQRRNKFNDAITKLGEAVKAINKVDNPSEKDSDNVQYPKIEIVQKAIACLTNCAQEKTQLKAEILALQVKIEASKQSPESKDASTQVHTSFSKKMQNGKYVKLLMLQKSKRKALKEKQILTTNVTVEGKSKKDLKINHIPPPPPKILPKSILNDKKRTENTIVVLPAAPYLFPQRPLFLPAVPPAFVIVDPNIQTLNKPSVPIVNRTGGDITKTTMVNILPISAYSRPLSATKTKKGNSKSKNDTTKKVKKKPNVPKNLKESVNKKQTNNVTVETNLKNNENPTIEKQKEVLATDTEVKCSKDPITNIKPPSNVDDNVVQSQKNKEDESSVINNKVTVNTSKTGETPNSITIKTVENVNLNDNLKAIAPPVQTNRNEILKEVNISLKSSSVEDKDKENKLPNILDTSLCESGVDGGNARLELAEEFLAASPTAAFLMSFPLVSGNRADSPAEDASNTVHTNVKDTSTQIAMPPAPNEIYFEKPSTNNDVKTKPIHKPPTSTAIPEKQSSQNKYLDNNILSKSLAKPSSSVAPSNPSNENPFLNLPMPSLIITTTQSDTFSLDFDCSITKSIPSQSSSYVSNSNLFYKSDPFNAVKSTIYSTSSIASGHEFNSLGLYPCAMEKYSKNKSDYTNVEDNLMKIGSSRLTYDIDLGWSHKGFDFVNGTTNSNTFSKDILTTATAPTYSSSYNPFNPEFHVPLVSASSKKDSSSKPMASFAETITSFYSTPQPANLWSEDMCFYNNSSASKTLTNKHQNYLHLEHAQPNASIKPPVTKQYETKIIPDPSLQNIMKPPNETIRQQLPEKYNKKSPNKMHINWMTSELRPMQNNCNPPPQTEMKEPHKQPYGQIEHSSKKQDHHEGNYFPIAIHNFAAQPAQEDFQVWPSTRPLGTTEISIEPPPINLPTLIGDLALGPHDKKKNADLSNRIGVQPDIQNCGNFLSVTQLMNRSSDNATSRYHGSTTETPKAIAGKQSNAQFSSDVNRKPMSSRVEINLPQPCYVFNEPKHSYENMGQFSQLKPKPNKSDKSTKVHKNSYSAEALIRSGNCTQKVQDHIGPKFMAPSQKYGDFNTSQDTSVAQVSHFPPILDYSDNSYTGQQFSGTTLYNATTNTISNSFYSNFMSGSANIMTGSYTSAPFTGDFMDYNQAECNYTNNKYEDFKMRGNPVFQEKVPSNYKSSRRESGTKHKLECSKKDGKKYQNKRAKVTETEEWSDANLFWQNKGQNKKGPNMLSEELSFANYVGNGMAPQYQHELFNSHLVNAPADRSLATFPATSRANFNLSTIFPEITMKVQ